MVLVVTQIYKCSKPWTIVTLLTKKRDNKSIFVYFNLKIFKFLKCSATTKTGVVY